MAKRAAEYAERAKELATRVEKQNLVSNILSQSASEKSGVKPIRKKKKLTDAERKRAAKVRCMKLRSTAKDSFFTNFFGGFFVQKLAS